MGSGGWGLGQKEWAGLDAPGSVRLDPGPWTLDPHSLPLFFFGGERGGGSGAGAGGGGGCGGPRGGARRGPLARQQRGDVGHFLGEGEADDGGVEEGAGVGAALGGA